MARDAARGFRELIAQGVDPIQQRRANQDALRASLAKRVTFNDAVARFLADRDGAWSNAKHRQQWENTLRTYASPVMGELVIGKIEFAHVLEVLRPIWKTKAETASRLRGRIENVLDWAKVHGYREGENPARWKGNLDHVLGVFSKPKEVNHHKALRHSEVGSFMAALRQRAGGAALALEFCILTAARSGEVRGATWEEINLDQKQWNIPARRMKAGREHRVPLSARAVEILTQLSDEESEGLIFKSARGGMLSDMTLSAVLKRMEVPVTVHGFRSTFRDWASEMGVASDLAERALAHTIRNAVEAAYHRTDLLEQRRGVMEAWGAYCAHDGSAIGQVLPMRAR
jgi:integrase